MTQAPLFEPTGPEVGPLALQHLHKAEQARKRAAVFASRCWEELAREQLARATEHEDEAECLGMLAMFERLGGVTA